MFPLTFRHRAGVSPYTSPFGFAETCVFDKQSPGPFHCGLSEDRHPLFRSYGVNMPSSLTTLLPLALGFSPHLPVSVCGTGALQIQLPFLATTYVCFPTKFQSLSPESTNPRDMLLPGVRLLKLFSGYGISTVCASTTPCGLALAPGLPWADEPAPGNLRFSAFTILTQISLLIPAFSLPLCPPLLPLRLHPQWNAPLPSNEVLANFQLPELRLHA